GTHLAHADVALDRHPIGDVRVASLAREHGDPVTTESPNHDEAMLGLIEPLAANLAAVLGRPHQASRGWRAPLQEEPTRLDLVAPHRFEKGGVKDEEGVGLSLGAGFEVVLAEAAFDRAGHAGPARGRGVSQALALLPVRSREGLQALLLDQVVPEIVDDLRNQ